MIYIDQLESTLSKFWSIHKIRLNHCLALRHFEQRFREIQSIFILLYNEISDLPDVNTSLLFSDYCQIDNTTKCTKEIDLTLIQLDALRQRVQVIISIGVFLAYITYVCINI